ncbi:MAG: flagellar filament capping protein FliD [Sporomusaceae bacterium]|nr:flagellar filament capping protein FliD [Sporomusaceae bacterium]
MAGISGLNPYGTYNILYNRNTGRSSSGSTGSYGSEFQQLDALFSNLKLIANYTSGQVASQRSAYQTQIKEYAAEIKNLAGSAGSLRSLADTAGASRKISAVKEFAASFNNLAKTLSEADNLTAEGRGLLKTLKAAASVRENELKQIGIAYDSDSGELTVDEVKLKKAVETDYGKVQETLTGSSGLAASVDKTISAAVKEPVSEYLAAPTAQATDYTKLLGGNATAYYGAYSRGLLLDLLA